MFGVSGEFVTSGRTTGVRVARVVGVCLLVLSTIGYSAWVLEFVLPGGPPPLRSYVSEASAIGQPHRDLFRLLDIVAGAAYLLAVPFLLRLVPAHATPRLTVVAVGLMGAILLLRAAFTLDCAESLSELCRARADSGQVSAAHNVRVALSVLSTVLYLIGIASAERWWPWGFWRNSARVALVLVISTSIVIVLLASLGPGMLVGLPMRIQLVTMAMILFVGAGYLVRSARSPA